MKAFTLIETIVAMLIFSVILMSIFLVMSIGQSSWFAGDTAVELRQQIILAISRMDSEISKTAPGQTNLSLDIPSASIRFHIPHDNNGDGSVVTTLGDIEWSGDITYSLDASNNIIRNSGGITSVIGRNIVSLQFTNIQNKLIQVDITARKNDNTGKTAQDTEQTIIKMRN